MSFRRRLNELFIERIRPQIVIEKENEVVIERENELEEKNENEIERKAQTSMNVARSSTKTDLKAEDDLNRLRFMKLS
jgi:hypothetical protein